MSKPSPVVERATELTRQAVTGLPVAAASDLLPGDGVRLHAVIAGAEEGPLAVLLHGFPECWYSWRHQIPVLAQAGYRVVVPDQRGYNLSDKPKAVQHYQIDHLTADVLSLMRALGRERADQHTARAAIVGHDWGGAVAWRMAIDFPEAVDRLVVMNAPHPVALAKAFKSDWGQRLRSWYMVFFQVPGLPEALLGISPQTSARLFFRRTAVRRDAFSDADLAVMAAAMAQPGALRGMIHWYRAAFRFKPAKRMRPIEAPTLLLWAEDDIALGKQLTLGLGRWVPHLEICYFPRCGHWVQNEAPEQVNERMMAFLSTPRGTA